VCTVAILTHVREYLEPTVIAGIIPHAVLIFGVTMVELNTRFLALILMALTRTGSYVHLLHRLVHLVHKLLIATWQIQRIMIAEVTSRVHGE